MALLASVVTGTLVPTGAQAAPSGGSLKVLEPADSFGSWPGLDPGTDTSAAANHDYLSAIFGELFEQGPKGAIPDLAAGYKLSADLRTLTISLRHGVKFTDGTPFNAAAVQFNIQRDLNPANGCICLPGFPVSSITTSGPYTVVLHLSRPFAPIISSFFSAAPDWIASPTALKTMGEKAFALKPVGAGPFEVVSDTPNSTLDLKRNPGYWQKGEPELDTLDFATVGTDQSAYSAMQSGQGQAYEEFATYSLISTVQKQTKLTPIVPSPTGATAVQLNTTVAPFNNIKAREAMYYATDPQPINQALYVGKATITQSLRSPGELFFEPTVPGYRTYDLAKAKQLVQELGGLTVQLDAEATMASLAEAVAGEWDKAGIKTTIHQESFEDNNQDYKTNNWQAKFDGGGGYDPGILLGLSFWYASNGPFTGNHDANLEKLIEQGTNVAGTEARGAVYKQIYQYISDQALSPVLFSAPLYNMTVKGVSGTGLTTPGPEVFWQTVTRS
jgi:peptide/nickel transport system substrate-binding protein